MKLENEKLQKLYDEGHKGAANLKPMTPENARERQEKSLEVRRKNKAIREANKLAVELFKDSGLEAAKELSGLDAMRLCRNRYILDEDWDKVAAISAQIAEYEDHKLTRVESAEVPDDFSEYNPEDLEDYLAKRITLDELNSRKNKK